MFVQYCVQFDHFSVVLKDILLIILYHFVLELLSFFVKSHLGLLPFELFFLSHLNRLPFLPELNNFTLVGFLLLPVLGLLRLSFQIFLSTLAEKY